MQVMGMKDHKHIKTIVNGPDFLMFCERCETRQDYDIRQVLGMNRPSEIVNRDFDTMKASMSDIVDRFESVHKDCVWVDTGKEYVCQASPKKDGKGIKLVIGDREILPTEEWPEEIENA